jgi:ribose-phosphate pyrophosphokinase
MRCLIVDDICDGGATFVALARKLREAGAIEVSLFVTHGIFSKGKDLEGIDNIYTTGSFTGKVYPKHGTRIEG